MIPLEGRPDPVNRANVEFVNNRAVRRLEPGTDVELFLNYVHRGSLIY
jgi:hypothetical protein